MTGPLVILLCLWTTDRPAAMPAVQISTVEGATFEARVISIHSDMLRYRLSDRDAEIPMSDVERIAVQSPDAPLAVATKEPVCTFYLADGGEVEGRILPPNNESLKGVRIQVEGLDPVNLGWDAIAAVQFGRIDHADAAAEFNSRMSHRAAGRDLLIVPKESKAVVLPGALERLEPDRWTFRFGDQLQSASLDKAFGVVLGGTGSANPERTAMMQLIGNHRLAGRIISADESSLRVDAGALGLLSLPWPTISAITLRSQRVTYLSDLESATTTQQSLFEVSWPPRRDANVTGGPIRLNGRTYSRGIGVHAYTAITYKLDGDFERLLATVGIDESAGGGAALFRVRGDDRIIYESDIITTRHPQSIAVDLRGIRELTLECDGGPDLDLSDHGDWADARLIRAPSKATR